MPDHVMAMKHTTVAYILYIFSIFRGKELAFIW